MNRHDEQIRQALAAEDSRVINDELPMLEQIIETFRGRNRWIVA